MRIILLAVLLLVSGCSYFTTVAERGAEGSDEALRVAIWTMCNATPVGAVKRRFDTTELVDAYNVICNSQELLPGPE